MSGCGASRRHAALLMLVALVPWAAGGGGAPTADGGTLAGVWHGTLGEHQVAVCFDGPDLDGAYYDLRHPRRIALHPQPDATWQEVAGDAPPDGSAVEEEDCDGPCAGVPEDPGTGIWHLGSPAGEDLTGRWTDAQTRQELPISLTRWRLISDPDARTTPMPPPCDNLVFTAPFAASTLVVTGEPRTFAGHRYRTRTVSTGDGSLVSGLELLEPGPHAAAISRALRGLPDTDAETAIELDDCRERGGDMDVRGEVEFWSGRWLGTAEVSLVECGGVHPNYGRTHRTWDLVTGAEVDLWGWIDDWPRLRTLVLGRALSAPDLVAEAARVDERGSDESCTATLEVGPVTWKAPYLGLNGMVFATEFPHVVQACDQEVEIPYAELIPFATATGLKEILHLLATLPTLPPPPPVRSPAAAMP